MQLILYPALHCSGSFAKCLDVSQIDTEYEPTVINHANYNAMIKEVRQHFTLDPSMAPVFMNSNQLNDKNMKRFIGIVCAVHQATADEPDGKDRRRTEHAEDEEEKEDDGYISLTSYDKVFNNIFPPEETLKEIIQFGM